MHAVPFFHRPVAWNTKSEVLPAILVGSTPEASTHLWGCADAALVGVSCWSGQV